MLAHRTTAATLYWYGWWNFVRTFASCSRKFRCICNFITLFIDLPYFEYIPLREKEGSIQYSNVISNISVHPLKTLFFKLIKIFPFVCDIHIWQNSYALSFNIFIVFIRTVLTPLLTQQGNLNIFQPSLRLVYCFKLQCLTEFAIDLEQCSNVIWYLFFDYSLNCLQQRKFFTLLWITNNYALY